MSSYLGQAPVFGDYPFHMLTGDGTASYTLNFSASSANGVLLFLNGAVQRPNIDYTVVGNALTFSEVVPNGVQIFAYGMGLPKSNLNPSDGATIATPTQFDSSNQIATTAFVQNALGNHSEFQTFSGNLTLTAANAGGYFKAALTSGVATLTLPTAPPAGSCFTVTNGVSSTYALTVAAPGGIGSTLAYSNQPSVVMRPGTQAVFVATSSGYDMINGSGMASLGSNGYKKFPDGMIIQWGEIAGGAVATGNGRTDIHTLPLTFPNAILSVCGTATSSGGAYVSAWVSLASTASVSIRVWNDAGSGGGTQTIGSRYIAIGY